VRPNGRRSPFDRSPDPLVRPAPPLPGASSRQWPPPPAVECRRAAWGRGRPRWEPARLARLHAARPGPEPENLQKHREIPPESPMFASGLNYTFEVDRLSVTVEGRTEVSGLPLCDLSQATCDPTSSGGGVSPPACCCSRR